jgi:elongation factor Tu
MAKLVEALDKNIEIPDRPKDKDFLMSVDGAMNISGRGTVVTGTVE